jgi:hypothetical protein
MFDAFVERGEPTVFSCEVGQIMIDCSFLRIGLQCRQIISMRWALRYPQTSPGQRVPFPWRVHCLFGLDTEEAQFDE